MLKSKTKAWTLSNNQLTNHFVNGFAISCYDSDISIKSNSFCFRLDNGLRMPTIFALSCLQISSITTSRALDWLSLEQKMDREKVTERKREREREREREIRHITQEKVPLKSSRCLAWDERQEEKRLKKSISTLYPNLYATF